MRDPRDEYWDLQLRLERMSEAGYDGPEGQRLLDRQDETARQVALETGDEFWHERAYDPTGARTHYRSQGGRF